MVVRGTWKEEVLSLGEWAEGELEKKGEGIIVWIKMGPTMT
jgi:hypothetical protein